MLIVIEGLDGSGKSTQVRLLKDYLTAKAGSIEYIHFPRYEAPVYGDLIGRFLRGDFGGNNEVHPNLVALLFAEDRHGAAPQMRRSLQEGRIVLFDRYVYSNIAYQCAKVCDESQRKILREWIFNTEYKEFAIPVPDVNIFLDVPLSFVESKLKSSRNGGDRAYLEGADDIHESDMGFQKRVREIYLEQCALDPSFVPVNCSDENGGMASSEVIFNRIRTIIDNSLGW